MTRYDVLLKARTTLAESGIIVYIIRVAVIFCRKTRVYRRILYFNNTTFGETFRAGINFTIQ